MSDQPKNGAGGKTLLPEFLPAPSVSEGGVLPTPKQRVAERARIFLQRFRGLGNVAGAAVLSLQCTGYGVVDPLPPPPQQCSARPDPFSQILAQAVIGDQPDAGPAPVVVDLHTNPYPATLGFRVVAVRVSGGELISVRDESLPGDRGNSHFLITVTPAPEAATLWLDVDLGCGAATGTKHYRLLIDRGAGPGSVVLVFEDNGAPDAGAD